MDLTDRPVLRKFGSYEFYYLLEEREGEAFVQHASCSYSPQWLPADTLAYVEDRAAYVPGQEVVILSQGFENFSGRHFTLREWNGDLLRLDGDLAPMEKQCHYWHAHPTHLPVRMLRSSGRPTQLTLF